MKLRRIAMVLACVLALGAATAAQQRGKAKAQGKVVDEQNEPLPDVIVAAVMDGYDRPFQQAKTNRRGDWSIENLAAGKWRFFFGGKEGLEEKSVELEVGASGTVAVPEVKLSKAVDHTAVLNAEIQKAAEFIQTNQPAEARKIYESLLAKYPEALPEFRAQLHGAMAQTYAAENNQTGALEHLKKSLEIDPNNTDVKLVYGELLLQAGKPEEAEKVLLSMDLSQVKDPFPYFNIIITKINADKADEALELINKLMAQFPSEHALYYYRGRAHLSTKKFEEARADLEKFVAAAQPDARELPDAKKILEQLKDVK